MKKLIAIALLLICILGLVGCSKETKYQSTEIPNVSMRIENVSPIGATLTIKDTNDTDATKAFMDFLQTKEAKDVFVEYGFTIHE